MKEDINIRFACRTFPIQQILKCSFGINQTEMEILKYLMNKGDEVDMSELVDDIEKDRTTIQRSVNSLVDKDLVHKRQINQQSGGYIFVYKAKAKEHIKNKIIDNFNKFIETVTSEIDHW